MANNADLYVLLGRREYPQEIKHGGCIYFKLFSPFVKQYDHIAAAFHGHYIANEHS
jgi:hypothetical protein